MRVAQIHIPKVILVLTAVLCLLYPLSAPAGSEGAPEQEFTVIQRKSTPPPQDVPVPKEMAQEIRVILQGCPDYDTVAMFNDLLGQARGVAKVRQVALTLLPEQPDTCQAIWVLEAREQNAFALGRALFAELELARKLA